MKHILLILSVIFITQSDLLAQQKVETRLMQITTIESVVSGGIGRSKMIITKEDGTQEEKSMENLFSITGVNFRNVKNNESVILKTLKLYTDDGWKLLSSNPLTLSSADSGNGIFMTRYLLTKEEVKQ